MKTKGKAAAGGRRERREFTPEFEAEAARMMSERRALGVSLTQVGRELDVRPDQLRSWVKQARDTGQGGPVVEESVGQENRRLRREVAVLRQEQAFAKKVAVYFAKESRRGTPSSRAIGASSRCDSWVGCSRSRPLAPTPR